VKWCRIRARGDPDLLYVLRCWYWRVGIVCKSSQLIPQGGSNRQGTCQTNAPNVQTIFLLQE